MLAVDTSALMAVVLSETQARACRHALEAEPTLILSAATLVEALIVSSRRGVEDEMSRLIDGLGIEIVPVTAISARRAAEAYRRWGRNFHPAALNFSDCFAYEVAQAHGCPLLFVGEDFSGTDVRAAT